MLSGKKCRQDAREPPTRMSTLPQQNTPSVCHQSPSRSVSCPCAALAECVAPAADLRRSEEHTSELQSHLNLVCRLLLEKKKTTNMTVHSRSCDTCSITALDAYVQQHLRSLTERLHPMLTTLAAD